ncbi:MAG: hypothetical protein QOI98_444 [Solirubrobacteraceae bacterium]|nr:hypothetical protein [Solirubrobacteraceae bacterium]
MTQRPTFWSSFRHVDAAADPIALLRYLDEFNALPAVAAGKRRSIELLGAALGDGVLDLGCGAGDDTRALKEAVGPAGRAVGVDSSEHLIAEARERAGAAGVSVEYLVADASELPFADDTFAACRCDRTLQHLETPTRALAEMARVVSPGGRIVVSEAGNSLEGDATVHPDLLARARERFAPIGAKDGWFGAFVPLLLSRSGLRDVSVEERRDALPDYESASRCFSIDAIAREMVQAGESTPDEAHEWLSGLRADFAEGRVQAIVRIFHFSGTSPPGDPAVVGQPSKSES